MLCHHHAHALARTSGESWGLVVEDPRELEVTDRADDGLAFFRGLVLALPVALGLWVVILWSLWGVVL